MVLIERWASHAIATLLSQGETGNFSGPEVRLWEGRVSVGSSPRLAQITAYLETTPVWKSSSRKQLLISNRPTILTSNLLHLASSARTIFSLLRCRGSSPVERGPEKAGVGSSTLPPGTTCSSNKISSPGVSESLFENSKSPGFCSDRLERMRKKQFVVILRRAFRRRISL